MNEHARCQGELTAEKADNARLRDLITQLREQDRDGAARLAVRAVVSLVARWSVSTMTIVCVGAGDGS